MTDFLEVFCKIFPDLQEAKEFMALDANKVRQKLAEQGEREKRLERMLARYRRWLKKVGAPKKEIRDKIAGLRMYLQYQDGTGIPFGEPAYMCDGMAIYPDGTIEDGW
jgi:hypothetical protein